MSKRLKRKIRDICQLDYLSKEERRIAATKILHDNNTKQKLCNAYPGLSFKDIERAMRDILAERQPTEDELEERAIPEKFDSISLPISKSTNKTRYKILSPEETQVLVMASEAPFAPDPASQKPSQKYSTYTLEETLALIKGTYDPNNFKKKYTKAQKVTRSVVKIDI